MNDDELFAALREQRGKIHMTTPVEQIIGRGRAVRGRRRVPVVAGALGTTAAAALAVSVALPASHPGAGIRQPGHPGASHTASVPAARLAAWTVTRQGNGSIKITFRQATDPAGLQRTLRADGIPANVNFTGHVNSACSPYPRGNGSRSIGPGSTGGPNPWAAYHSRNHAVRFEKATSHNASAMYHSRYALVIHPKALPSGAGLQIFTSGTPGSADNFNLVVRVVKASPQCTGS
jgi:hypothetical protein